MESPESQIRTKSVTIVENENEKELSNEEKPFEVEDSKFMSLISALENYTKNGKLAIEEIEQEPTITKQASLSVANGWVKLDFVCLSISFFNFTTICPSSVTPALLRQKIIENHRGSISEVIMYKERVARENFISNPQKLHKTLLELGLPGGEKDFPLVYKIYYDYKHTPIDCPLLNFRA